MYVYLLLLSSVTLPNAARMDQPCFLEVSEDNAVLVFTGKFGWYRNPSISDPLSSVVRKSLKKLCSNITGISFEFIPQTTR